jgi:hypothetical protein
MKSSPIIGRRAAARVSTPLLLIALLTFTSVRLNADTATCGGGTVTLPFTDVPAANVFFCSIAEAFFAGLSNGTTATTYSPSANVTRDQMAAFTTRTMEESIRRNNRRAVTKKWYMPPDPSGITLISAVGSDTETVEFDGTDLWAAGRTSQTVRR